MNKSLAKYYKDGKEPYVIFNYVGLRDKLNALQKEVERSLQKRMVALRSRRLVEDIVQVRHTPTTKTRAYRKYRLNGGRHVFVDTLSEMSLS